jgi:WD40 repeat protein
MSPLFLALVLVGEFIVGGELYSLLRLDRYGDSLPSGAAARLGTMRLRHQYVHSLVFSPDGKFLASGGWDAAVRLWDKHTGRQIACFRNLGDSVESVAFSADGTTLAAAGTAEGRGFVSIWDLSSRKQVNRFVHEHGLSVALSPDGTLVTSGGLDSLRVWNVKTGSEVLRVDGMDLATGSATITPDGKTLVVHGGAGGLTLWSLTSDEPPRRLPNQPYGVRWLSFSQDGKTFVSDECNAIRIRDACDGKELHCVQFESKEQTRTALSVDRKTLVVEERGAVRVFDMETGKVRKDFKTDREYFSAVALSPKGDSFAMGHTEIRLWDTNDGKLRLAVPGHSESVCSVCFLPDSSSVATAGWDENVCVWDTATSRRLRALPLGLLSPDGKTLASPAKGDRIEMWDVAEGKIRCRLDLKPDPVGTLTWTPDGKTLATSEFDESIRLWDVETGKERKRIRGPFLYVTQPEFTWDGQRFLFVNAKQNTLDVWDLATDRTKMLLPTEKIEFPTVMARDSRILATLGRSSNSVHRADLILLWDVSNMTVTHRLPWRTLEKEFVRGKLAGLFCPAEPLTFSPDGRMVTGLDGPKSQVLRLWDVTRGIEARRFVGHNAEIVRVLFSSDGRTLATIDKKNSILVWEVATGQEVAEFSGHEAEIESIAFSPDGRFMASGSADTTALVWDLTGCLKAGRLPSRRLNAQEMAALWNELADADARKARMAMWNLIADRDRSVPFLKKQLLAIAERDARKVSAWVTDLNDDQFEKREVAAKELAKLGETAVLALNKVLAGPPSEDAQRRATEILEKLAVALPTPEQARVLRAIEALEHIGTKDAMDALRELAHQTNLSEITRESKAVLARITAESKRRP